MIYVISDLHGYPLERFKELLSLADFSDDDTLYILGDVIDRNGDGGVEMLLWLTEQPNIRLIIGNHEAMLVSCSFVFFEVDDVLVRELNADKLDALSNYMWNGGDVTLRNLKKLPTERRLKILEYLMECPLYETVTVNGRDYLLVHSGLGNFSPERDLSDYTLDELVWTRPSLTDDYFDDITTVFGHTPTGYYGRRYAGRIIRTRTWTDIDVGAGHGEEPVLLRLDDDMEFSLPSI